MAVKRGAHCKEGSFREKKSGKLEYRITYKDGCGFTRRKSFTGVDEWDCLEQADEFLGKIEKLMMGIDMDATIADLVQARYDADLAKNHVGEQGYSRNMHTLGIIRKSQIGNIPIADLTELHMDLFLGTITKYSNSVIQKVYQQLRIGFSIACDKEIIKRNLMLSKDLRCPKSDKATKKVRGMTEKEQADFVRILKTHKVPHGRNDYKLQLLIELYGGMRMGEINALKPENIDFGKNIIHIENTVSRGKDYRDFIKDGTKTYNGVRDIPINNLMKPLLAEALEKRKKNPHGLVFYDYNKDNIIATTQVNCFFRRMCEKAQVEYYGQHALRHTFATRCIEAGVPAVVLKNWLGHKDIHMTLDIYADVFDRMNFGAIEKLEDYISGYENRKEKAAEETN